MALGAANWFGAEGGIEASAEEMGNGADGFKAVSGLAGAAGAAVFCLAMSANAFKILEVSGAAAELLAPRGFEPGAGDPSGVVDSMSEQAVSTAGKAKSEMKKKAREL